jgi:hypothetical protein
MEGRDFISPWREKNLLANGSELRNSREGLITITLSCPSDILSQGEVGIPPLLNFSTLIFLH